jgi:hypothetical protein
MTDKLQTVAESISSNTVVMRNGGLLDAEIDNEIVTLNIETGNCYGLNKVGSRIWSNLAAPIQVSDLCTRLMSEYKVEPATCENQVLELLAEMRAEGLITTQDR